MNNSFFVEYSFSKVVSGFPCECKGNKTYSTEYYESIDGMIDDVLKLLKERDAMVTFQLFTGYETKDLLRIIREYDSSLTVCHWKRNTSDYVSECWQDTQLKNCRSTVKKYVLETLNLFREAA